MRTQHLLSLSTIVLLCTTSLSAMKFETLGYKATSMGGAAVASSSSSHAVYNNPALLAIQPRTVEVSLGAGVTATDHGAGASYVKLDDVGFFDALDNASSDYSTLSATDKKSLADSKYIFLGLNNNAIALAPQAYLGTQVSSFGFGIYESSDILATAIVDQTYDQLIFQDNASPTGFTLINDDGSESDSSLVDYEASSVQYAMEKGLTYVDTRGVAITEVPIGYGHNFETSVGNIMIGGALKYMYGVTYTQIVSFEDSQDDQTKEELKSSNFGVDIGLAYQPSFSYDLTIGLVAKNLNAPSFEFDDGTEYTIDPMVRAGIAYNLLDDLQIATDIDLTTNETLRDGVKSQMLGGGIIYEPFSDIFALSLRAGLQQNLHTSDVAGLVYTAGLGIGVKWIQIDLSGEMASNTNEIEGTSVPQYAKVSLALISRW